MRTTLPRFDITSCFTTVMTTTVLATSLSYNTIAVADDISVYTASLNAQARPNILFVLDYSGSMGDNVSGGAATATNPSKETILETAVNNLLAQNADRFNAGIMVFSNTASGIQWPVSDLTVNANTIDPAIPAAAGLTGADIISSIMANESAGGWTATVPALVEAALYFRGDAVSAGGSGNSDVRRFAPQTWSAANNRYENGFNYAPNPAAYSPKNAYLANGAPGSTASCNNYDPNGGVNLCPGSTFNCTNVGANGDANYRQSCNYTQNDSWAGASYISPIVDECQENYIVLITDGDPTKNWGYDALDNVLGTSSAACEDLSPSIFNDDSGNCAIEIVQELSTNDQIASVTGSTVKTFTIGFSIGNAGEQFLRRVADEGDGEFHLANNAQQLVQALNDTIDEILKGSESFAALSIGIDKARFSHENRAFYTIFSPSLSRSWKGNLKGYFIDDDGLKDINNAQATISDANGTRFRDTAQSFWSTTIDGNEAELGGASAKLSTAARTLYTYTGGNIPTGGIALQQSDDKHDLIAGNPNISPTLLGAADNTTRDALINWLHDAPMGAPLHSSSVLIKYPGKTVAYVMTNQGLMHAIDATAPTDPLAGDSSGGSELFAFMPPELLINLPELQASGLTGPHIYGLDGGITKWHEDTNSNGVVDNGETVQLVFGMRRGGSNYYSLDVTDPANPVYKWKIAGGSGSFGDLAQSWSRPALVTAKYGTGSERVLIFGGGYDAAANDAATTRTAGGGNSVFVIDRDGNHLWHATHSDMNYSIPSDISVIDTDQDGNADRMYFGDTGGQLWRVDFDRVNVNGDYSVTRIADLGSASFQPFFYAPSVALNWTAGKPFMSLSIGSGHRPRPLDVTSQNKLFMVRDENVSTGPVPAAFSTLQMSDLYDATANEIYSSDKTTSDNAKDAMAAAKGWYVNLAAGEKSLSKTVTFEGRLLATTFMPLSSGGGADSCQAAGTNGGRYYSLDLATAGAVDPLSDPDNPPDPLTSSDRSIAITTRGIPSTPQVVFPQNGDVQIVVDKRAVSIVQQRLDRVMWHPRD